MSVGAHMHRNDLTYGRSLYEKEEHSNMVSIATINHMKTMKFM